jgi:hypothetical protein
MGLLDEAIRQHLDLKRRHGADPAEVERAEREALGPVRRNREAPVGSDSDDDQVAGGIAYDQADDWSYDEGAERLGDASAGEPELPPLELSADEIVDNPRPRRPEPEPMSDEPAFGESAFEEPAFEDSPAQSPRPSFAPGLTGGETAEYDVEEAIADDEDGSGEDMLEETPEFLQDTPDHDRLWFEQRPPKDFDFDG